MQMKRQAQRGRATGSRPHSSQGAAWSPAPGPGSPKVRIQEPPGGEGSLLHKAPGCLVFGVEDMSLPAGPLLPGLCDSG